MTATVMTVRPNRRALTGRWVLALIGVALIASSCASSDPSPAADPVAQIETTDAAVATSCEELLDIVFAIHQEFINVFGAGPFEDWYTNSPSVSPNVQAGMDVWMEKAGKSSEQSASLGCDEGAEAEKDSCGPMSQLDPLGDAGLGFMHDMVPCDLDPKDQARVDEFLASQQ